MDGVDAVSTCRIGVIEFSDYFWMGRLEIGECVVSFGSIIWTFIRTRGLPHPTLPKIHLVRWRNPGTDPIPRHHGPPPHNGFHHDNPNESLLSIRQTLPYDHLSGAPLFRDNRPHDRAAKISRSERVQKLHFQSILLRVSLFPSTLHSGIWILGPNRLYASNHVGGKRHEVFLWNSDLHVAFQSLRDDLGASTAVQENDEISTLQV